MTKEQIGDFTRRISQSNRGELVVIMYDVAFVYMEDAIRAHEEESWEAYKEALRKGQQMINELIGALDFSYDMAKNLCSIYIFCRDLLAEAIYKRETEDITAAERLLRKLYDGFVHAAKEDKSEPLMRNTQQIYAGYTYGRGDLVETCQDSGTSRGFFA